MGLIQDGPGELFHGRCVERPRPCLLSRFLFGLSRVTYRSWTQGRLQGLCLVQPTVPGHSGPRRAQGWGGTVPGRQGCLGSAVLISSPELPEAASVLGQAALGRAGGREDEGSPAWRVNLITVDLHLKSSRETVFVYPRRRSYP